MSETLLSSEPSSPTATKSPPQELTTTAPHDNDVLCGRGGTVNAHPGNEQYRKFIDRKKQLYVTARFKREKRLISSMIVDQVRNLNPPGRFLMKDPANPSIWHDIGDEKAREKTSQALRETALTVRRQLEEDFRKAQQANAALAGVTTKGHPPPPPDSSAGPMGGWRNQPPIQQHQTQQQQQQQQQPPPPYWAYQQPYDPNYPPPPPQQQPALQRQLVNSPAPNYPYFAQSSLKQLPEMLLQQQQQQPTYYDYEGMTSQYQWNSQQQQQHQGQQQWVTQQQQQAPQYTTNTYTASVTQQQSVPSTTQQPTAINLRPSSIFRTTLGGEHRHVQFQTTIDTQEQQQQQQQQQEQQQQEQFGMDVPLVISPIQRMHPRNMQYPLEWADGPTVTPKRHNTDRLVSEGWNDVGPTMPLNYVPSSIQRVNTLTSSQAGESMSLGGGQSQHTAATQATPLTLLSTNFSFNLRSPEDDRDMELSEYLQGIEDEMYGDVGQEVELVAHAPLFMGGTEGSNTTNPDNNDTDHHHQQQQQHHGVPRSTPPRPYGSGSGGSRSGASYRKRRSGTHIPSNSGKVQLDMSTLGGGGVANGGGGGREGLQQEVVSSPLFSPQIASCGDLLSPNSPMSPGYSLDLDKMSLCGTENISHAGGSLGGASLCNVFDDPTLDSPEAGSANLMDGSLPSDGTRGTSGSDSYDAQFGLGPPQPRPQSSRVSAPEFGENESLMGTSTRMDMSVDSGPHSGSSKQSSIPSKGQNSSSDGSSRGSSMTRRSGSPSSIDKASVDGGGENREDQTIAEETQTLTDSWIAPPPSTEE